MYDTSGRIIDVNQKICQSLGYSRDELLSTSISEIDPDAAQEGKEMVWNDILAGENYTF
jgi:PAS domain S-box-containing protein